MRFAEAAAPVAALRAAVPTLDDVDAHPESVFIWSVILAVRREMRASDTTVQHFPFTD